ncbi:adenylate/guanylate cyclase domain-containing protein [Pseudonocardia sp. DSM 110487]|uniref:adenylate/guanylate cyclase domain-containing protein n=1 Tax=Pseudonocardia sp. DSM 110487 TaxID=2865833 RepID=UPI001C6A4901|nr:adenylate/guanylate cyclase domain-containing protein [Pseudonocardia sp. DSM 110487]QYN35548.1 adenylate/guanylate cyclase domain-containing protein [Pseudonocardia sp. DSM 110487]
MTRSRRVRRWVIDWPARIALAVVVLVANVVGAVVVFVLAAWVLPEGPLGDPGLVRTENVVAFGLYLLVSLPMGLWWGGRRFRLRRGEPDAEQRRERRMVLYGPLRLVTVQGVLWAAAVPVFVLLNLRYSVRLAVAVGDTILLGGITTCALGYLLSERILRRTAARVLATHPPLPRRGLPGIVVRSLLFWALGTGVPVVGLMIAAIAALVHGDVPAGRLAVIMLAVGGTALAAGLLVTVGAARAVADPVNAVRRAMRRVERGKLDTSVTVYDGTELGQLQSGFNTMVAGLRERERIHDLFGRHVGRDVARAAAAAGEVRLGGEVRRVGVLFVDLVGSTSLTAEQPPEEVVGLLNRFFAVVVEVVEEHDGWINKFEGDAALAVFGAPVAGIDPAGCALAAGRVLATRLAAELPDVTAGIGISAGDAVAGNVGDVRRYEYTVIGDPVNEAARLTDLAKTVAGRVLASADAVAMALEDEAARWELGDATVLRGRTTPTRLATPKEHAPRQPDRAAAAGTR